MLRTETACSNYCHMYISQCLWLRVQLSPIWHDIDLHTWTIHHKTCIIHKVEYWMCSISWVHYLKHTWLVLPWYTVCIYWNSFRKKYCMQINMLQMIIVGFITMLLLNDSKVPLNDFSMPDLLKAQNHNDVFGSSGWLWWQAWRTWTLQSFPHMDTPVR